MVPPVTVVPTQRRTTMFAGYGESPRESTPAAPVAPVVQPTRKGSKAVRRRTERELTADEAVRNLMKDMFGKGNPWFVTDGKASPAVDTPAAPVKEPDPVPAPVAPVAEPAPVPVKKTKAAPVRPVIPAPPEQDTITRDGDGQMALVLPETGKPLALPGEGAAPRRRREVATGRDEDQIDLFTAEASAFAPDPALELAEFKRSIESSPEDLQLLLDLDYENALGKTIGFDRIRTHHQNALNDKTESGRRRRRTAKKGEAEYEDQSQDTDLRREYTERRGKLIRRLSVSVLFTLLIFIYEQAGWMAALFEDGLVDGTKYPASYILMGLQLLAPIAFASAKPLLAGFKSLLRMTPDDYALCAVSLIATVLYHAVLIFVPHHGALPTLYLSPVALLLTLQPLGDLFSWYRESMAFHVVADRRNKYALLPRVSVGGMLWDDHSRLLGDVDAQGIRFAYHVNFVRNYRENTKKRARGHHSALGMPLLIVLALALALGLYTLVAGGGAIVTLQTVFATMLLCLPATAALVTCLPMFWAALLRLRRSSAIIGEVPVHESEGIHTLVIPDGEVFGAMYHEQFEVPEEVVEGKRVHVLVNALLEKLHSPLVYSVSVKRDERISADHVTLTEIGDTGVSALVGDDAVPLFMGDEAYMREKGVALKLRPSAAEAGQGKRLLYVAMRDRVVAFFLARYRLNEDMARLLREIDNEPIRILVRSKDPGICDALFEELLPEQREPVRVMRPTAEEMDLRAERVDATVVALETCRDVIRAHVTCRRICAVHRMGDLSRFASMVGGALIAILMTLLGRGVALPGVAICAYLLLWCTGYGLLSFLRLRPKKNN